VIAFVKEITPLKSAIWPVLFYMTLSLLVLCILSVLTSYQLSIAGHYKAKSFWENKKPGEDNSNFPYHLANWVRRVNLLSGILFFLAIILLVVFMIANVMKERTMTEKPEQIGEMIVQEGSHIKVPRPGVSQESRIIDTPAPAQQQHSGQTQQSNGGSSGSKTSQER
jgi:hypothetical protein